MKSSSVLAMRKKLRKANPGSVWEGGHLYDKDGNLVRGAPELPKPGRTVGPVRTSETTAARVQRSMTSTVLRGYKVVVPSNNLARCGKCNEYLDFYPNRMAVTCISCKAINNRLV